MKLERQIEDMDDERTVGVPPLRPWIAPIPLGAKREG